MRRVPATHASMRSGTSEHGRLKNLPLHSLTEAWVRQAIAAGCDPFMQQEPLSSEGLAGEWVLVLSLAGLKSPFYAGQLPDELLDEVFVVLSRLERVTHDPYLRPWHGNVLLDVTSSRALAFRIKLVRDALGMDGRRFYGACGIDPIVGDAIEAGFLSFLSPGHELLQKIAAHHDIPEEWLANGTAEEIEA